MTGPREFLKRLISALENAQIPYMLSGSFGSGFHGEPRATNDIDIVIVSTLEQLNQFVKLLGEEYYVSLEAARDAFTQNSMFNIIDMQTGWKADLIIRKNRPFSRQEFQRRRKVKLMDLDIWMLSPEDLILSKLEWSKAQQSQQQFRDALGVAVVQWDRLDHEYLQEWAQNLQVKYLLKQLLSEAKELRSKKL